MEWGWVFRWRVSWDSGGSLLAAAFPLGVLGLSYIGAREIYRAVTKRRRSVMGGLFDKILAEVHACIENRAVEGAEAPSQLPPAD